MTDPFKDAMTRVAERLPDLTGALCVGRWDLFDAAAAHEPADAVAYRHAHAVARCRRCPVLDACAEAQRSSLRAAGVVAGVAPAPPPPRRRPAVAQGQSGPRGALTDEQIERVRAMRADGGTLSAIGATFGCSRNVIARALARAEGSTAS